mgnify:FL=1
MINRDILASCFSGSRRCLGFICLVTCGLLLSACGSTPVAPAKGSEPASRQQQYRPKYHKVRKGDTLYAVSWKAGVDYKTLARWNGLRSPYTIYPGQRLRLTRPQSKKPPGKTASKTKPRTKTAAKSRPKTVEPGSAAATPAIQSSSPGGNNKKVKYSANAKLQWVWPAKGKLVGTYSSTDSSRDGIKIAGKRGQKIRAAESGDVVYVGSGLVGYGRLIIIKHNKQFLSAYGHNSRLLVKEGDFVKKGTHIADMGLAHSGQALLHFEIRKYGKPVNPIPHLPR